MAFAKSNYKDWKKFTLITPVDKEENVRFYTKKCGFKIAVTEMDGNVKVVRFVLERKNWKCHINCQFSSKYMTFGKKSGRFAEEKSYEFANIKICMFLYENTG